MFTSPEEATAWSSLLRVLMPYTTEAQVVGVVTSQFGVTVSLEGGEAIRFRAADLNAIVPGIVLAGQRVEEVRTDG